MNTIYTVSEAYEAPHAYFTTLAKAEAYIAKVSAERKALDLYAHEYYIEVATLDEECE